MTKHPGTTPQNLFNNAARLGIPRTGEDLISLSQNFNPALQRYAIDADRADRNTVIDSLTATAPYLFPGALQTPSFIEQQFKGSGEDIDVKSVVSFRVGRGLLLLEKGAQQNIIIRERNLNLVRNVCSKIVLADQIEYALAVVEEYPSVSIRVLLEKAEELNNHELGYIMATHKMNDQTTSVSATQEIPNTKSLCIHPASIPTVQQYLDTASELALSVEDSRQWLNKQP